MCVWGGVDRVHVCVCVWGGGVRSPACVRLPMRVCVCVSLYACIRRCTGVRALVCLSVLLIIIIGYGTPSHKSSCVKINYCSLASVQDHP